MKLTKEDKIVLSKLLTAFQNAAPLLEQLRRLDKDEKVYRRQFILSDVTVPTDTLPWLDVLFCQMKKGNALVELSSEVTADRYLKLSAEGPRWAVDLVIGEFRVFLGDLRARCPDFDLTTLSTEQWCWGYVFGILHYLKYGHVRRFLPQRGNTFPSESLIEFLGIPAASAQDDPHHWCMGEYYGQQKGRRWRESTNNELWGRIFNW